MIKASAAEIFLLCFHRVLHIFLNLEFLAGVSWALIDAKFSGASLVAHALPRARNVRPKKNDCNFVMVKSFSGNFLSFAYLNYSSK